jgi:hypothetical protein
MARLQRAIVAVVAIAALAAAAIGVTTTSGGGLDRTEATAAVTPIRAAFYYPWFTQTWHSNDHYQPVAGRYSSDDTAILAQQISQAKYAGLDAFISSWWGADTVTGKRLPLVLGAAQAQNFKVTPYYEKEGLGNPSQAEIAGELDGLAALADRYGDTWLRVGGKPVLFVYNADDTSCAVVDKWTAANAGRFYLDLKVFSGFRDCPTQPDSWHQYGPASGLQSHLPFATAVSPGFWEHDEAAPRLARDLTRFAADLGRQVASGSQWQLVTSWNEWGEGTAVEPGVQWTSASGYGTFLDAMHTAYTGEKAPAPTPTTPAPTPAPTPTPVPTTSAPEPTVGPTPTGTGDPTPTPTTGAGVDPVIAAAGDVACPPGEGVTAAGCHQKITSDQVLALDPDEVLALGDLQYESGTAAEFASYDASWGRFKARTRPAVGNHEYNTAGAAPYYDYFGALAGPAGKGYYSHDVGTWHLIALNSNCSMVSGGCGTSGAQYAWLQADFAAHPATCTLAYWHHPRYTTAEHTNAQNMNDLWNLLVQHHVDVALQGHNHTYERFDKLGAGTGNGSRGAPTVDSGGIRSFVVGTGGKNHYTFSVPAYPGEQVRNDDSFGVLKMTLRRGSYSWQFLPEPGKTFTDSGSESCR